MKNTKSHASYCEFYNEIMQKTTKITFEQFLTLHAAKLIDSRKIHYVTTDLNDDFGHFEMDLDLPKYQYGMFFS